MSRKRLIAPGFFTNADLFDAEAAAGLPLRVAFAGLWTVADRRGVFRWSRNIKPDVLPYDSCDMLACLDALERAGFVRSYEEDGRRYGWIPAFGAHQTFHMREKPSRDPAPPSAWLAPGQHETLAPSPSPENPVPAQGQHGASTVLGTDKAVPSPSVTVTVTGTVTGTASTALRGPDQTLPNGQGTAPPAGASPRTAGEAFNAFVAQAGDLWGTLVGTPDYGRIAADLKAPHRLHGPQACLAAIQRFAEHRTRAVKAGAEKPDSWPQFVRDLVDYIPRSMRPVPRQEVA